jgi:hypothetical protein
MTPLHVEQSRTYPASVEHAFQVILPRPLPEIFSRRYGPLPAVSSVRDQDGVWGTVGQTRTIVLAGGGTMCEELTHVEPPDAFGYRITGITGSMKPLVASVDGRWTFTPAGTGVRVTWAWTLHPASAVAGFAMPVFGRLWRGYARQALEQVEQLLLT